MVGNCRRLVAIALGCLSAATTAVGAPPEVSERARRVHDASILFDGHNDLPWMMREHGDVKFEKFDIGQRMKGGQTDIPRIRQGGLKAQFWSVFIPSEHPNPAQTVTEQIDLVHRMVERYPNDLEFANTADDVERIVKAGKVASLIGIEGGVAIENNLAQLRAFHRLGARYMTLTHNKSLDWVDAAFGSHDNHGLSPFGERVVREMNRLGMFVDISHVSPETMEDVLRISQAPVIASHSSAFAITPSPRNVPDNILKELPKNGGVVMVNFYTEFIKHESPRLAAEEKALKEKFPNPEDYKKAYEEWAKVNKSPRGTIPDLVDHIDHIVKVAGIDHVGIGSDFDGINSWPVGLEDVSCYPLLTEELVRRGYSDTDIPKILGGNVIRAFREAGKVAERLQKTTAPEVDQHKAP